MRTRLMSVATTASLVACLVAWPAVAQDASTGPTTPPDPGTPVAVPYVDGAGVTHGSVLIRSIEDPFTGFDPASPPPEGQRYVLLTVSFEAAGDQTMNADPSAILLQDTDGFLRWSSWVPRPQPVMVPDFQSQTLAPGDRVSGAIGYVVPAASSLATVLYAPEHNRYIPLQRASAGPGPAVGDPIAALDAAGVIHGTVTVRELADPFTEFEPTAPPPEGARYVMLSVVFEAAEDQSLWADPNGITLQDANGYLLASAWVPRPAGDVVPDLQSQTLAPGDRISGMVGFQVPVGSTLSAVLWSPESSRFVPLVDLGG